MEEWIGYIRWWAYIAVGGILLTVLTLSLVPWPEAVSLVWIPTLLYICVGGAVALIGLAVVGISRLARRS